MVVITDKILLTPSEAAKQASVSRSTLYRWMGIRGFPVLHLGGCTRIDRERLVEWLRAQGGGDNA